MDQAGCSAKLALGMEFKVHLGVTAAASNGGDQRCANDNQGREQALFEACIDRELVDDTD